MIDRYIVLDNWAKLMGTTVSYCTNSIYISIFTCIYGCMEEEGRRSKVSFQPHINTGFHFSLRFPGGGAGIMRILNEKMLYNERDINSSRSVDLPVGQSVGWSVGRPVI